MKSPTLEEVKEYFKDAEIVRDWAGDEGIVNLNNIEKLDNGNVVQDTSKKDWLILWHHIDGYAKIITHKQTTYTITKEQVLKYNMKYEFPEVFEVKLEKFKEGHYWFHSNGSLVLISEVTKCHGGTIKCKHISNSENFAFHGLCCMERKATEQEVFEALKNEAVKRFPIDSQIKCLNNGDIKKVSKDSTIDYYFIANDAYYAGVMIFDNGKWAEVMPTMTKKEAEEKLGCKII